MSVTPLIHCQRLWRRRITTIVPQRTASTTSSGNTRSKRRRFFDDDKPLTLDHFLLRSKVLSLYRSFCRDTKGTARLQKSTSAQYLIYKGLYLRLSAGLGDLASRLDTLAWIRTDFERHKHERDLNKIKALIAGWKRQLKHISSQGMLVGHDGEKFRGRRAVS